MRLGEDDDDDKCSAAAVVIAKLSFGSTNSYYYLPQVGEKLTSNNEWSELRRISVRNHVRQSYWIKV